MGLMAREGLRFLQCICKNKKWNEELPNFSELKVGILISQIPILDFRLAPNCSQALRQSIHRSRCVTWYQSKSRGKFSRSLAENSSSLRGIGITCLICPVRLARMSSGIVCNPAIQTISWLAVYITDPLTHRNSLPWTTWQSCLA